MHQQRIGNQFSADFESKTKSLPSVVFEYGLFAKLDLVSKATGRRTPSNDLFKFFIHFKSGSQATPFVKP